MSKRGLAGDMGRAVLIALVIFLLTVLVVRAAVAQTRACTSHQMMASMLQERWGENRVFIGIDAAGNLAELYVNVETGSWTIVASQPGGDSCIVAAGNSGQVQHPTSGEES